VVHFDRRSGTKFLLPPRRCSESWERPRSIWTRRNETCNDTQHNPPGSTSGTNLEQSRTPRHPPLPPQQLPNRLENSLPHPQHLLGLLPLQWRQDHLLTFHHLAHVRIDPEHRPAGILPVLDKLEHRLRHVLDRDEDGGAVGDGELRHFVRVVGPEGSLDDPGVRKLASAAHLVLVEFYESQSRLRKGTEPRDTGKREGKERNGTGRNEEETYPGQTATTLTPSSPSASAMLLTKPTIACFVAQYSGVAYMPTSPATDATISTTPFLSAPSSARTAIRASLIGWLMLMSTSAYRSGSASSQKLDHFCHHGTKKC